jgi:lysozyme family protein
VPAAEFRYDLKCVLVYEGGKVDDPRDPGGRTNQGVTQRVYNAYRRRKGVVVRDVYLMEEGERDEIYKVQYWDRIKGDELPDGVAFVIFDAAVNSGVAQAARWAQKAAPGYPDSKVDGDFGAQTVVAIQQVNDVDAFIRKYCALRLGTLKRLKTWKTYGDGWSARLANVQKTGLALSAAVEPPPPVELSAINGQRKAVVPDNVVHPPISVTTANIAAGATAISTGATQAAQQLSGVDTTHLTYLKYALMGVTALSAVAGVVALISSKASEAARNGVREAEVDPEADQLGVPVQIA